MNTEIYKLYRVIRLALKQDEPITLLQIGKERVAVATGIGIEPLEVVILEIGSKKTAIEFFKHNPPTPIEVENAIMAVEDEITRMREAIPNDSMLVTSDECIREIALFCGLDNQPGLNLNREAVERAFERLSSVVQGLPMPSLSPLSNAIFSSTILILREFMHHMNFLSIRIVNPRSND